MKTRSIVQEKVAALTAQDTGRPEWVRLPKPGRRCIHTGLSRSTLNELVIPCEVNNFLPPVKSAVIKKRGAMRGIRLVSYDSLMAHIESLCTVDERGCCS
jgi:hypothetical protein